MRTWGGRIMVDQPKPAVGQIWREVDPRFTRFVRIESVGSFFRNEEVIGIRNVANDQHVGWISPKGARFTRASGKRFHGKRGGYAFVEEPY